MPNLNVVTITLPNFEEATYLGSLALSHAVDYMRVHGLTVDDLAGEDAVRTKVLDSLSRNDPVFFTGCVSEDSIIPLPNGNIVQVKDLDQPTGIFSTYIEGSLKEQGSKKKARLDVDTCIQLIFKGYREVWRLKTPFMEIEATPDHEFFVRSSDPKDGAQASWKPLSQIKVGDKILITTKLPFMTTVNPPLSEQQIQCLGFYVGDGTMYKEEHRTWQVRLTDLQAKEEYMDLFKEAFNVKPIEKRRRGFLICNKRLVSLIEDLGLGVKSPYRDIPEVICRSPLQHQLAFISGLLDSDGHVRPEHGEIAFYSSSRSMLAKLQMLLLRFGILSTIRWRSRLGEPVTIEGKITGYTKHPSGELVVSGISAFELARLLNPLSENKRKALKELIDRYLKLERKQKPEGLARVNEYLAFLRVKKIEKAGVKPVYDLVVKNNHNFIVNGIIAHNCGHGSSSLFTGQGYDRIWWVCDCSQLRGRVVFLLSCLTGQQLGPDMVNNKGAWCYAGYKVEFTWIQEARVDPLADKYGKAFFEPVLELIYSLADGHTMGEAFRASVDKWNYWIDYWSRSSDPEAAAMVMYLIWDRDGQVLIGDESAAITSAVPWPWWLLMGLGFAPVGAVISIAGTEELRKLGVLAV